VLSVKGKPGGEKAAFREEASTPLARPGRHRPLQGLQRLVLSLAELGEAADIEIASAIVLESRQCGMLPEDVGGGAIGEGVAEAHALRDLGEDPPVGLRVAGQRQEGALA
jgi:hypothetical protein